VHAEVIVREHEAFGEDSDAVARNIELQRVRGEEVSIGRLISIRALMERNPTFLRALPMIRSDSPFE
jgi:hypothetical protein